MLIQQAMDRLMVGRTTLVVAHRLSTSCAPWTVAVMDRGRIIEGSHDDPFGAACIGACSATEQTKA